MTEKEYNEMVIILANADYKDNVTCYTTAGKIFEKEFKNQSTDINEIKNSYEYKKETFQLEVVEEWLKTNQMKTNKLTYGYYNALMKTMPSYSIGFNLPETLDFKTREDIYHILVMSGYLETKKGE